ncbi:MAG: hypothetical protein IIW63_07965 [Clostridia bacterium]|jgi:hypothetical protein|nr:hypothetical protein [Clostridia bacterium]
MKKRPFAVRGKFVYCLLPLILLLTAMYLYATASVPVASGGEMKAQSVFEIIEKLTEG